MLIVPPYQRLSPAVADLLTVRLAPSAPCAPAHLSDVQPIAAALLAGFEGTLRPCRAARLWAHTPG